MELTRGGRQLIGFLPQSPEILEFLESPIPPPANSANQSKILVRSQLISLVISEPILIPLSQDESKHAISVLRLKQNELVRVVDPNLNLIAQGKLKISGKIAQVEIELIGKPVKKYPHILIGMPEPKTAEACVEKLVEIGVSGITFFKADHSQASSSNFDKLKVRLLKKRDVAIKQSYSFTAPLISLVLNLREALSSFGGDKIITDPHALLGTARRGPTDPSLQTDKDRSVGARRAVPNNAIKTPITLFSPKDAEILDQNKIKLENLRNLFDNNQITSHLVIGPEGGFSLQELNLLVSLGSRFLSLGENTLRVETAATLAVASINCLNS